MRVAMRSPNDTKLSLARGVRSCMQARHMHTHLQHHNMCMHRQCHDTCMRVGVRQSHLQVHSIRALLASLPPVWHPPGINTPPRLITLTYHTLPSYAPCTICAMPPPALTSHLHDGDANEQLLQLVDEPANLLLHLHLHAQLSTSVHVQLAQGTGSKHNTMQTSTRT